MRSARCSKVRLCWYTSHEPYPMMPTAISATTANVRIGIQLRPWLTLTGAIGRRGPLPVAGRADLAFADVAPAFAGAVPAFPAVPFEREDAVRVGFERGAGLSSASVESTLAESASTDAESESTGASG